jgi:energy-coupling factor transporter ATP-binding protein EcfA2
MPKTQVRDLRASIYKPGSKAVPVTYRPNDRYAIVGKTGSGKTHFAIVLATTLIASVNETEVDPWSCWWVDSKGDPADIKRLRDWGYVRVKTLGADFDPDGPEYFRYFKLERLGDDENVYPQVSAIALAAYERSRSAKRPRPTLLLIDEWAQAVKTMRSMGPRLLDIEQRGRGNRCGLIGLTQEPVDIPRQLISQATHLFIFDLTYERDLEYMLDYCPNYQSPSSLKAPHGFWYRHIDGQAGWLFFKHERDWFEWVKEPKAGDDGK